MGIGPGQDLLNRQGWQRSPVANAAVLRQQSGQAGAAPEAARAHLQRTLNVAPLFLAEGPGNDARLGYGPPACPSMPGVRPGQDLIDRECWPLLGAQPLGPP